MIRESWQANLDKVRAEAEAAYRPGMKYGDVEVTDINLHLHDLMAGPDETVPDPMARKETS